MGKLHGCSLFFFAMICTTHALFADAGSPESFNRRLLSKYLKIGGAISYSDEKYAMVFDAGSTGTRVHVFKFDSIRNLDLLSIGDGGREYEFNKKVIPGLSKFADNITAVAGSLRELLQPALALIPQEIRTQTPVSLGATGGLRLLSNASADRILDAVRELLRNESGLNYRHNRVSVIDGFQEGSYMWVTMNFLLGNLGKPYSDTVGVVDLGGASVQMAYSISDQDAANAAESLGQDNDNYLVQWNLRSRNYSLYAHSYLKYGIQAARAQILKLTGDHRGNPCVINGYEGTYNYSGESYKVKPPPSGTNMFSCRILTRRILNITASCPHKDCTFNGVWNGGAGDGLKNLYVASSFYHTATAADIFDRSLASAKIHPKAYRDAAKIACRTDKANMKSRFPNLREDNLPFLCMDLLYEYSLLVSGFGIKRTREITVVQKLEYKGSKFEAAWPLGCAIDILAPPEMKLSLYRASS